MLRIRREIINKIVAHSRTAVPEEACGYLAEKDGVVCRHIEMTNMDHSSVHFSMDPAEQFAVVKECRRQGLKIRAVYHSHPNSPARPSCEDIRLAYDPVISYVIVSLMKPEPVVGSFAINKGIVIQEKIRILD